MRKIIQPCGFHCIKINNLGVSFGEQTVLEDVNMHIHCGSFNVIIGQNGAGKSTLIKAILGEIPHTGTIEFKDTKDGHMAKLKIGYVPQSVNIEKNTPVSVYDLIASYRYNYPVFLPKSKKIGAKIRETLEVFEAEELIDKQVCNLSGGQLQRVLLSMAIMDEPNLLLLDSFLTVAIYQDIQPAVILTKVDLDRGEKLESLYADAGIPVYLVDYDKPETIDNVAKLLDGKISMMTGNSGVGKSTLLNAIAPELQLATGEISEKLGRGKHTTRQVQLYPCAGGYLADTPGFSTFEVEQYLQMDKDCNAVCFPEFRPYLGQCRFSDCAHVCEKGCAVVEAVRAGKIAKSRHDAYVSLYQTAKQRKAWES